MSLGVQAKSAPGVGDDDAVAGVARGVADLDGEVGTDAADVTGEGGDVLGALVGDTGDAVVVDNDGGRGDGLLGGFREFVCVIGGLAGSVDYGVHDSAVGDAAGESDEVAAFAFEVFGGGALAGKEVNGHADCRGCAGTDGCEGSRGTEGRRQIRWNQVQHGSLWRKA